MVRKQPMKQLMTAVHQQVKRKLNFVIQKVISFQVFCIFQGLETLLN